ncbi:tetratricopeptide repeat protein [Weissella soli]|uniref:tetratricopeptide repeat protein n=1 Tax=Weissella soli TaxID=155866 RepID=UPI001F47D766|nr:tetratricopeptide repeat protein [Weissella soli]MCT8395288.1 hypothetical protein [Weissella soli]GJM48500.1 hypothetical protein WSSLDB02_10570 [Weissella soli]
MTEQTGLQTDMQKLVAAIEAAPQNWPAYVDLVNVLIVSENYLEAEELGLKSLGIFADNFAAVQQLNYAVGNLYYAVGAYDKANEFFGKIADATLLHDATMMQAQAFYAKNDFKQALVFALTGIEQVADDEAAIILLGNIWLGLQDFTQAAAAFEKALALNSKSFDANFGRGLVQTVHGEPGNHWLATAQAIDGDRYQNQAQRLDEIAQLLAGSKNE